MHFSHILITAFAGIIAQGNIVAALPNAEPGNDHSYIGGKSARLDIETRAVESDKEIDHEEVALETRVTHIFPEFPVSSNDLLWVGVIGSCGYAFLRETGATAWVWSKVPDLDKRKEWYGKAGTCIANAWNKMFSKKADREQVARALEASGERIVDGASLTRGVGGAALQAVGVNPPSTG